MNKYLKMIKEGWFGETEEDKFFLLLAYSGALSILWCVKWSLVGFLYDKSLDKT